MNQPIIVTVKNNLSAPRNLAWLARGPKWLPGNGTVQVDYEPWSAGNDAQRKLLIAELNNKWITLSISLLRADGSYAQTDYNPAGEKKAAPQSSLTRQALPVQEDAGALAKDGRTHVVIAGGNKNIAARMGFKADSAAPEAVQQLAAQTGVGFQAQSAGPAPAGSLTTAEIRANIEQSKEAAETEEYQPVDVMDIEDSGSSLVKQFDALTAEHKWAEALKLLIDTYGEEKVTFNTRAIMALKTFAAVRQKYDL